MRGPSSSLFGPRPDPRRAEPTARTSGVNRCMIESNFPPDGPALHGFVGRVSPRLGDKILHVPDSSA
jgi:hypothetical protein